MVWGRPPKYYKSTSERRGGMKVEFFPSPDMGQASSGCGVSGVKPKSGVLSVSKTKMFFERERECVCCSLSSR